MTINKTIAFVSDVLDPHIEIPVPVGTIELTEEHVQAFFKENPKATHIRMPKGIRQIGEEAFASQKILV